VRKALALLACRAPALLLWLTPCGAFADARSSLPHLQSDEAAEVVFLLRAGTAESLATASLLAHLTQPSDYAATAGGGTPPEPALLIERAVSMAPGRPELAWLRLRECQSRRCADEAPIAARLQELDPDNGLAWLGDLNAAQAKSPEDVTRVIQRIGAAPGPRIYWNALTVMMFDALTHRDRRQPPTAITQHADDRLLHVTGVLAALDVPAFRPLAYACGTEQLDASGRRAACERAMARLEAADAVITQLVRLSVLEGWWPAASPEGAALRRERAQRRYLTVASNRLRPGHADRDAELRVETMRNAPREQDVERAMLQAFHEPLQRPEGWRGDAVATQ
jgi:hypothetical protein